MKNEYADVALDQIELSTTNTMFRDPADFTPAALHDLVDSIKKSGVLSPILLRKGKKKKYELVCGERRYRASQEAKLTVIPASIRDLKDDEALEAQVVENLQRENINPMKEAVAFEWMTKTKKISAAAIADRIGKSADYVQERIKLTSLHKEAQEMIRTGALPLKAGLKISRLPQQLQKKALDYSPEDVEGAEGRKSVFAGLERLQDFLDDEVVFNLAYADFDLADPKLLPTAGSCISCPKRTKNTGGLFDDVLKTDSCLDRGCFRAKQMAQYQQVEAEVKKTYPTASIIKLARTDQYYLDDHLKQKLSPMIYSVPSASTEITAVQATKLVTDKKKFTVAILIGMDRNGKDSKKRFIILKNETKPASTTSGRSSSPSTPARSAAAVAKEKDEAVKQLKQNYLEVMFKAEAILKKAQLKVLPDSYLRELIMMELDSGSTEDVMTALNFLGVEYKVGKWANSKRELITIKPGASIPLDMSEIADEYHIDDSSVEKAIEKLKGEKLNALLIWFRSCSHDGRDLVKQFKIDLKAISDKAKTETTAWWNKEAEKKSELLKVLRSDANSKTPVKKQPIKK